MRSSFFRAAILCFAASVLGTLTIHAGLTACTPKPEPAQTPQAAAPPQAAAAVEPPPVATPAPAAKDDQNDDSWRYMGATKAAPVFHPPRAKPANANAPPPQMPQQQAAP
jgi:hypothetical protein